MADKRLEHWLRPRKWDPVAEMKRYEKFSVRERGECIDQLCTLAAEILESRPDRDEVLRHQEPRPPYAEAWWREFVRRSREMRLDKSD